MKRYLAYPRLPATEALIILHKMQETIAQGPQGLTELVAYDHPRAEAVPTGAAVATAEQIATTRTQVMESLAPWMTGRSVGRDSTIPFDIALGEALHRSLSILPADAAHEGTWSFLSAVVFPDVVWARFPDLHRDRLIGKRHRNTLRRAWSRYDVLGDLQSQAVVPLGEDEMTGLFERSQLARDRHLLRTLAEMILTSDAPNRSQFARGLLKGVTALTGTYLLDGLGAKELQERLAGLVATPNRTARHRWADGEGDPPSSIRAGVHPTQESTSPRTEAPRSIRTPAAQAAQKSIPERRAAGRSDLVRLFHTEMLELANQIEREAGHRPTQLRRMIAGVGGVEAARAIVGAPHPSETFTSLLLDGRSDLTVEALVLDDDFRGLFTEALLERAAARLGRSADSPFTDAR